MSKVIISLVVGVGFFIAGMIVAKKTDNLSGRDNGHDYDDDGGYDDDDYDDEDYEDGEEEEEEYFDDEDPDEEDDEDPNNFETQVIR